MKCPYCEKEIVADRLFCTWCESYVPHPGTGTKAGVFRRWFASAIDPFLLVAAVFIPSAIVGGAAGSAAGLLAMLITLATVLIGFFRLFVQGLLPGKYLMGGQVVDKLTGANPGFGKMLLPESIGKSISGFVLGLGFFWAIWDKDNQAWHDKIAGTVVVKRRTDASLFASRVLHRVESQ